MRSAPTAPAARLPNTVSAHAPMDIGERVLKTRSMFKKRDGRPRSSTSSGGDGISAASETRRAIPGGGGSPARSQASATNAEPEAMPPVQKYSGTSHVHT